MVSTWGDQGLARSEAWQAIPGVSEWVMTMVRRGYTLQFARRPPRFHGVLAITQQVRGEDAPVLSAEVMNLLEKGAIEIVPPAQSESGFYSRNFLVPKKTVAYSRSQTPELHPDEMAVQDDHFETDPLANMPRGLVHVAGSERRVLSHPGSPPSQTILEIRIRRGGISIQGPPVWSVPGSPHFYTMHGCGSLPSATDGNPHTQLPRRLAHSGPVAGVFNIAQDPPPQPLSLPVAQGQLSQEQTVTQPASFFPGHSYRLSADDSNHFSGARHDNSALRGFLRGKDSLSAQSFPENAGPYGSGFAGTSVGSASHAIYPVLAEAEGSIHGLASRTPPSNRDSGLCISPGRWRDLFWLKQDVILDTSHRRKVVMTDASNKGWGALCEGKLTFGLWSEKESGLHINCLEMIAVCQACQFFLPDKRGHHVLVCADSRSVVS